MIKAHLHRGHIVRVVALAKCVLLVAVWVATVPAHAGPQSAIPSENIMLPNLRQPVEILIDHWGVPHIYAVNEADRVVVGSRSHENTKTRRSGLVFIVCAMQRSCAASMWVAMS